MTDPQADGPHRAAARRAWIREHHPDRGGDPAVFIEGLRRLQDPGPPDPLPSGTTSPGASSGVRAFRRRRLTPYRWFRRVRRARRHGHRNLQ